MLKKKYQLFLGIITAITCFVTVYFYLYSVDRVSKIYINKTRLTILDLKKDYLKDTVNNIILEIDNVRARKTKNVRKLVRNTSQLIRTKNNLSDQEFNAYFIDFFNDNTDTSWSVLLWDNLNNKAVYDPKMLSGDSWDTTYAVIKNALSTYQIIVHGDVKAVIGISKADIDKRVKEEISDKIRDLRFGDNSYLWVNEILNYQGGSNYAIRRVHPNQPETEGMYLSTDRKDEKGNEPYLMELQGINNKGELFFTYFYKELTNDKVSEKLTYSKLYKKYNWVIAMGVYLDDIDALTYHSDKETDKLVSKLLIGLVSIFIFILLISYSLIMLLDVLYHKNSKRLLETEINKDPLSKADSRRSGTNDLARAFKEFKWNGTNAGILLFDVDYFKNINDTYGHAVGDQVLMDIVKAVYSVLRSTDKLIRWGGDEFVVIFYGLQSKYALNYSNTILSVVSSINTKAADQTINPTLSIGFSCFKETDIDFNNVLKRADDALYQSKMNGRNQVNIIL